MTLPLDVTPFFTGEELSYGASGLPTGLGIDASSGIISGSPSVEGTSAVTVTATNSAGSAGQSFNWTITAAQGQTGGGVTAEAGAAGHWVFGTDFAGYDDLVSGQTLSELIAGAATLGTGEVTISNGDGSTAQARRGLVSTRSQQVEQTLCFVVSSSTGDRIIGGNLSTTDGAGLFTFGSALFGNARGLPFNNTQFEASIPQTAPYIFVAMSVSATQDWILFRGDPSASVVASGAPLSAPVPTAEPLGIGNTAYDSASFSAGGSYGEFIIFDGHRTATEIEAIYQRSKARMTARGITVL